MVIVDTWIATGSINENDSNSGVSHFLEHLFFKGSKKYRQGEFEKIAKQMNYQSADDLFAALGYGETTLNKIINKVH